MLVGGSLLVSALLILSPLPLCVRSSSLTHTVSKTAVERPGSFFEVAPRENARNNVGAIKANASNDQSESSTNHLTGSGIVKNQANGNEFVVVIDCGSSGSRIQIYLWPQGSPKSSLACRLQTLRDSDMLRPLSMQIRPGLSSVRDEPNQASDYLVPLLKFAARHVPRDQHRSTSVYVMGTAGLRSLTINERNRILDDVMADSSKEFDFELIQASAISGSEEGFFQWLSVNLLAKRLNKNYNQIQGPAFHFQRSSSRRFGLIEMGGVSAQVAFEVTPTMDRIIRSRLSVEARHVFESLRLETQVNFSQDNAEGQDVDGTTTSSIFSVSFLGFGSDSARSLAVDLLIRDAMKRLAFTRSGGLSASLMPLIIQPNATLVLEDPCLPLNSEDSTTKPISVLYSPTKTIGYNTARRAEPAIQVRLVGRSHFVQCHALVERLLTLSLREKTTCSQLDEHNVCDNPLIGSAFVPWRQLQFLGLGDLFYTTDLLNLSGPFSSSALLQRTVSICSRSSSELDVLYGAVSEFERQRNKMACFKANWILVWLMRVLRMPADSLANLTTTGNVQGEPVDWKLGAVLAQTVGYRRLWAS